MAAEARDLWPDVLMEEADSPPLALLREQAAILSRKTDGLVEAEVRTDVDENSDTLRSIHRFYLKTIGPLVGDYRYLLFTLFEGEGGTIFPVELHRGGREPVRAADMLALEELLKSVFRDSSTKRIIGILASKASG